MGTDALFPDLNGPMVSMAFERACRKADVPNLRLRGLRHTFSVLSGDGRPHPVGHSTVFRAQRPAHDGEVCPSFGRLSAASGIEGGYSSRVEPGDRLEFISIYDILGLQRKEATAMGT